MPFRLLKSEVLKLALLFRAVIELNCLKKLSDKNITRFIKPKLSNRRLIFHFSSERCLHEPGPQTVSRSESFTTRFEILNKRLLRYGFKSRTSEEPEHCCCA